MTESAANWLELVISLPTENATERMRVWRALKTTGAVVLRDGVYVIPDRPDLEEVFTRLASEIDEAGGSAHVLRIVARDAEQADALRGLFDRTKEYAELAGEIADVRKVASRRTGRLFAGRCGPCAGSSRPWPPSTSSRRGQGQVESALIEAEAAAAEILEPGEPRAAKGPIPRLDRAQYRKRVWATRRAPWVDRLACAWLIKRHIDPGASFVWLREARRPARRRGGIRLRRGPVHPRRHPRDVRGDAPELRARRGRRAG